MTSCPSWCTEHESPDLTVHPDDQCHVHVTERRLGATDVTVLVEQHAGLGSEPEDEPRVVIHASAEPLEPEQARQLAALLVELADLAEAAPC